MAETTVLRSSASPRNTSPVTSTATPHVQVSGALPLVNVVMGGAGGKVPVPAGSQPAKQGVVVMPLKGTVPQPQRGPGGFVGKVEILPPRTAAPKPALSSDELMLCRHLVTRYQDDAAFEGNDENIKLAAATLASLDQALADAAAIAAAPPAAARRVVASGPGVQVAAAAAPRRVPARPPAPQVRDEIIDVTSDDIVDMPNVG